MDGLLYYCECVDPVCEDPAAGLPAETEDCE